MMDGILVQDSDWSSKLSNSLVELLEKKLLCDLGIVCGGVRNNVNNLKSDEVVMAHRCILAGASETIRKLSVAGQLYNLVKINGLEISQQCWNNVIEFVYKGKTEVISNNLCDVRKAAQVLQIKLLEKAIDVHHSMLASCFCGKKKSVETTGKGRGIDDGISCTVSDSSWLTTLFEGMLDLLVKQSLCNMTIITEKQEKISAEILAHLCMLVASSSTIRELVLQGTETYNSVKIDSIAYNTWLYLLEYIYTSRVSIVKSNIPEVWIASQLLQIDGLANAVGTFASKMVSIPSDNPTQSTQRQVNEIPEELSDKSIENMNNTLRKETSHLNESHQVDIVAPPPLSEGIINVKTESSPGEITDDSNNLLHTPIADLEGSNLQGQIPNSSTPLEVGDNPSMLTPSSSTDSTSSILVNQLLQEPLQPAASQLTSPLLNVSIGLPTDTIAVTVGQQFLVPASSALQVVTAGLPSTLPVAAAANQTASAAPAISPNIATGSGQLINTLQPDGSTAMLWVPNQLLPVVNTGPIQSQDVKPVISSSQTTVMKDEDLPGQKVDTPETDSAETSPSKLLSIENKEPADLNTDKAYLYFCNKCMHVFSEKAFLDKHKCMKNSNVTGSPPANQSQGQHVNKLTCKYCHKMFSRTWTLNVHLRTHTGERPYKCKYCSKAFSDKSNMRQHSLIHTSRKEYHCPKCNQAFAQKRYMKKHYMETCRRKYPSANDYVNLDDSPPSTTPTNQRHKNITSHNHKLSSNYIIYQLPGDNSTTKSVNNSLESKDGSSIEDALGTSPDDGNSSELELDLKCDVDLGKQSLAKSDSIDTAWNTSIIMDRSRHVMGDEDDGDDDGEEEDIENNDNEVDFSLQDDEDEVPDTPATSCTTPTFPLSCKKCKKQFKTERQQRSHRCVTF